MYVIDTSLLLAKLTKYRGIFEVNRRGNHGKFAENGLNT